MTDPVLYMDTDAVQTIANGFAVVATALRALSKAMQQIIEFLRSSAIVGLIGHVALETFLANLKPKIDDMAEFCEEISHDLEEAIQLYMNADEQGASRFY